MITDPQSTFNEPGYLKLLFLLADTQTWINELSKQTFHQIPLANKNKLQRKTYYLTPTALAHIVERHYYKICRHPQAGKFHIPLLEIMQLLRDAADINTLPVSGSLNFQRIMQAPTEIGYDKDGHPATLLTIITDAGGRIITAFPGLLP